MQKFYENLETAHTSKCSQYNLEFADQGYEVSPLLFGGNLEHSRSAISGGLSAQMLRNRKFVGMPNSFRGNAAEWFIIGDKTFGMLESDQTGRKSSSRMTAVESYTRHSFLGYHMKRRYECNAQMVQNLGNGSAGIGQHELYVKKDCKYEFRIVLHTDMPVKLKIAITSRGGSEVYASETVVVEGEEWQTYTAALKSVCTDEEIDTDDFIALCREIGAEPSITINITWNTPEENAAWVEYCNGGDSDTVGPYTEFSVQSVSSICDNGFCGITVPPKSVTLLRFAKMA